MVDTRWLDDEEQEAWRAYLHASRLLTDGLDRELQRVVGMPHSYYGILAALSEAPKRALTMSELAQQTRSSPSKLSHAMAKLEQNGWVVRERCSWNGRQILATLTDEGHDVLVRAAPRAADQVRSALFDVLTRAQIRQMRDIFSSVLANLERPAAASRPFPRAALTDAESTAKDRRRTGGDETLIEGPPQWIPGNAQ